VFTDDFASMAEQARTIAAWGRNMIACFIPTHRRR
jgi:hypothetical protein